MAKLVSTPEFESFTGYLQALSCVVMPYLGWEAFIDAKLLENESGSVNIEEVLRAAYPAESWLENSAKDINVSPLDRFIHYIEKAICLHGDYLKEAPSAGHGENIEWRLRKGFWTSLRKCFDYENAHIAKVHDFRAGDGLEEEEVTYVLYSSDRENCMVLVVGVVV